MIALVTLMLVLVGVVLVAPSVQGEVLAIIGYFIVGIVAGATAAGITIGYRLRREELRVSELNEQSFRVAGEPLRVDGGE